MKPWIICSTTMLLLAGTNAPARGQQKSVAPSASKIQYARDILPILSTHCFTCHGPDDKLRKAGLRLDSHEAAIKNLKTGSRAIVPGKVKESELIVRLHAEDSERMPPKSANKVLKDSEKKL